MTELSTGAEIATATGAEPRTYKILDSHMGYLTEKLLKMNRKAKKLYCQPIQIIETGTVDEVAEDGISVLRFHLVQLQGERPIINGWAFAATLQHVAEIGNIVRMVPGETIPTEYRDAAPDCDHCRYNRRRNETFIIRNVESGAYQQIGRKCLADFLGGASAESYAAYAEMLADMEQELGNTEEIEYSGASGSRFFRLETYLSFVVKCVQEDGWLSRGKAREEEGATATADRAMRDMFPFSAKYQPTQPTDAHIAEAKSAMAWAEENLRDKADLNDYMHNMKVVTSTTAIDHKMVGLAASLIPLVRREMQQVNEARATRDMLRASSYVGTAGENVTFAAKCISITTIDSDWGINYLHRFLTVEGDIITCFHKTLDVEQGDTVEVRAKIKRHTDYKGTKQTEVNYAKILRKITP